MNILKKIKGLILPQVIDFFSDLTEQSKNTESIIKELKSIYTDKGNNNIFDLISNAKESRKNKLKQLEKVFITPVDREAISRSYTHLHWVVLSVEHLVIELKTYAIHNLKEYQPILDLLHKEIRDLTSAFELLNSKKYNKILTKVNHVIHSDNTLITEYAKQLNLLFKKEKIEYILQQREILSQLKEISKRIHFCANQIEDIVFKMN